MMIDNDKKIVYLDKTIEQPEEIRDLGHGIIEKVKPIHKPWIDTDTMVQCCNDGYEFVRFLGGVEVDASFLDEDVPESIVPILEEETARPKWRDMPHFESKNANKVMIYICSAMPGDTSWTGASNERFQAMVSIFGITNILHKTPFFEMRKVESIEV